MVRYGLSAGIVTALALGAGVGMAHAQTAAQPARPAARAAPRLNFSTDSFTTGQAASPDRSQYTGQGVRSVMQWDTSNRWGVRLQLDQPVARPLKPEDVEAGAYYRVTPSVRVGGAVGVADKPRPVSPSTSAREQVAPRVRLETSLRF